MLAIGELYRADEEIEETRAAVFDSVRFLDLSQVPPSVAERVGFETALRLKEVLDRIRLPVPRSIPDARQMEQPRPRNRTASRVSSLSMTPTSISSPQRGLLPRRTCCMVSRPPLLRGL